MQRSRQSVRPGSFSIILLALLTLVACDDRFFGKDAAAEAERIRQGAADAREKMLRIEARAGITVDSIENRALVGFGVPHEEAAIKAERGWSIRVTHLSEPKGSDLFLNATTWSRDGLNWRTLVLNVDGRVYEIVMHDGSTYSLVSEVQESRVQRVGAQEYLALAAASRGSRVRGRFKGEGVRRMDFELSEDDKAHFRDMLEYSRLYGIVHPAYGLEQGLGRASRGRTARPAPM